MLCPTGMEIGDELWSREYRSSNQALTNTSHFPEHFCKYGVVWDGIQSRSIAVTTVVKAGKGHGVKPMRFKNSVSRSPS